MSETNDLAAEILLADFLLQEVMSHSANDPKGILLANLGWAVMHNKPELKHLLQQYKLGRFIRTRLAGRVEVKADEHNPTEMRVVPSHNLPADYADATVPQVVEPVVPRQYSRATLIAFTRPIPEEHSRVLHFRDPLFFRDIPSQEAKLDSTSALISKEDIIQSELPLPANLLQTFDAHIDAWRSKYGVELEALLQQKKRTSTTSPHLSGSLLDALFESLSPADLKRIQLPLDIVAKLKAIQR